jgi:hypothetical protein
MELIDDLQKLGVSNHIGLPQVNYSMIFATRDTDNI